MPDMRAFCLMHVRWHVLRACDLFASGHACAGALSLRIGRRVSSSGSARCGSLSRHNLTQPQRRRG